MSQKYSIGDTKEDFYKKLMLYNMFQSIKDDLKSIPNEPSEKLDDSMEISDNLSNNSFDKIDEEQIFFNQKRDRIKKKIEENSKNWLDKEKAQNKTALKQNNTNFIQKNSNINALNSKNKAQIKRLNGMTVRVNKTYPKLDKF